MVSQIVVSPDGNRADLIGQVQNAWNAFTAAIPNHPLANIPTRFDSQHAETLDSVAIAIPELAADPANDSGKIVLGHRRCLDAAYAVENRNLTLLHESLHLIDQTSTHRDRAEQVDQARVLLWRNHNRTYRQGNQPDREMHAYYRLMFGFEFVKMPDEVWAELLLRDQYAAFFDARMALYLQLRDDPARRANHAILQACIRKYYLAYEWFTLELARRIDQNPARLTRLAEIQTEWRDDLVAMIGEDDARDLLDRAANLLPADVAGIDPAEFDQFFNAVMATPLPV